MNKNIHLTYFYHKFERTCLHFDNISVYYASAPNDFFHFNKTKQKAERKKIVFNLKSAKKDKNVSITQRERNIYIQIYTYERMKTVCLDNAFVLFTFTDTCCCYCSTILIDATHISRSLIWLSKISNTTSFGKSVEIERRNKKKNCFHWTGTNRKKKQKLYTIFTIRNDVMKQCCVSWWRGDKTIQIFDWIFDRKKGKIRGKYLPQIEVYSYYFYSLLLFPIPIENFLQHKQSKWIFVLPKGNVIFMIFLMRFCFSSSLSTSAT